jgi:LAS superfamily LD-carboxypeptidase LdcB
MPGAEALDCASPAWRAAASANEASLSTLAWSPFGKAETGWAIYAPLLGHEIGAQCSADSAGFAARYAQWQAREGLPTDGVVKPADFDRLKNELALRRPFVRLTAKGACPAPPAEATLAAASPAEAYGGKLVRLRPGALAAYRRMVAAARGEGVGRRAPLLQLISGYRSPAEEASRCADASCNTLTRAHCSAHRTGLAIDLYLEPAAGSEPTSSDDANRRHMAATIEYHWLVANASRFGFLPYAYEPWHWEWTGEAP